MARIAAAFLALACISASTGGATACSCVRPDQQLTDKEYETWTYERAANVVRGRIVDLRAGLDTVKGGHRMVVAKMKIDFVIKGDVPIGDATILTGFGTGDCGIPHALLTGIAWDRDLVIEVRKIPELPREYVVDMCGYGKIFAMPGLEAPKN